MYYDNDHVRINLSSLSEKIIEQDFVIFGSAQKLSLNGFVNLVIYRFLNDYQSFPFFKLDNSYKEKGKSKMIRPNKRNQDLLKFLLNSSLSKLEIPDWYIPFDQDLTPSALFKAIVESYCRLPMIEREYVILKDLFDFVNKGIQEKRGLRIKVLGMVSRSMDIIPYKIVPAKDGPYSYLIGFVENKEEASGYSPRAVRISRMIFEGFTSHKKLPNDSVIKETDSSLAEYGPTFLKEKPKEIRVRFLSESAILKYQYSVLHRPIHNKIEKDEAGNPFIYTFLCSEKQAIYFFFKMAGSIQILSPVDLKEKFATMYKQGYEAIMGDSLNEKDA